MSTQAAALEWEPETIEVLEWENIAETRETDGLHEAIESANHLLKLGDNWDGEGSPGYKADTLLRAANFLREQDDLLDKICGMSVPIPRIDPGPDGSIDLFWKESTWELLVNISPEQTQPASFYGEDADGQVIKGTLKASESNLGLILWLMQH